MHFGDATDAKQNFFVNGLIQIIRKESERMNVWKRGFIAVLRKPTKNLLLALLVYCIIVLVMVGISAGHTSAQAQLEARNQVGAFFSLMLDMEDFHDRITQLEEQGYDLTVIPPPPANPMELKAPPNFEFMTLFMEDIESLAEVEGIMAYNIQAMMNFQVETVGFQRIEGEFPNEADEPIVSLIGVRDLSLMPTVQDGSISLASGRWVGPDDENALVISEKLAELNQLQVGDALTLETIPMQDTLMLEVMERLGFEEPSSVQMTGEIVGIFRNNRSISFNPGIVSQRSENQIFSSLNFPKVGIHENDPFYEIATFHVESVDQLEDVRARLEAVDVNWDRYVLWENNERIEELTPAFEQLQETGKLLLTAVLISSFIILSLVFIFLMKSRSHEIGIWLSLGQAKGNIVFQMVWEGLLVGMVAFSFCVLTAPLVISGAQTYFNRYMILDGSNIEHSITGDQLFLPEAVNEEESIALTITVGTIGMTMGVTIVLIVVSIGLAAIPVLRLKPREIFARLS